MKSRMGPIPGLALAIALDTVEAAPAAAEVLVVTSASAAKFFEDLGARVVIDEGGGLNAAASHGLAARRAGDQNDQRIGSESQALASNGGYAPVPLARMTSLTACGRAYDRPLGRTGRSPGLTSVGARCCPGLISVVQYPYKQNNVL